MLCFYQGVFEKRKPQENPVVLNNFAWLRSGFESWWGHWTDKIYVSPITPKGRNTTSVEAKLMWSSDLLLHVAFSASWAFCWLSIVVTFVVLNLSYFLHLNGLKHHWKCLPFSKESQMNSKIVQIHRQLFKIFYFMPLGLILDAELGKKKSYIKNFNLHKWFCSKARQTFKISPWESREDFNQTLHSYLG